MRLLPEERREGMFAVYAFCREIDDVADEPAPVGEKIARLREWRREIERLYDGRPQTLTGRALQPIMRDYDLEIGDFLALIDGMEMDAVEDIRAPSLAQLELYCDRVAGAVGRLSIRIFGAREPQAKTVARHLGQALQLTNILRDLDEDAEQGRLYLPAELLVANNIKTREPKAVLAHPALPAVCQALAARARQHYHDAAVAMRKCAKGPMRPAAAMGALYRGYLAVMERRGWTDRSRPVRLPKWRKLWIAVRYGLL
ncbi:MAG: presqualene diphosphate synthase HpnD [Rhodospirillaceae bacterium]|nr:presqualene diphosphate synthase HpnD [Rhodospirillaceae bacterium]